MKNGEWFKSSKSGSNGGQCVEVRMLDGRTHVRDSKDPHGPVLEFTDAEWSAFVDGAKNNEFDI